ncbi:MAG: hypothetical protein H6713_28310 [Myxococcales bacterium]|nr:hypothetical protein [Myxococcales bacterium]MCB9753865.1 hypothetical protein [Myxococcales bacterium]
MRNTQHALVHGLIAALGLALAACNVTIGPTTGDTDTGTGTITDGTDGTVGTTGGTEVTGATSDPSAGTTAGPVTSSTDPSTTDEMTSGTDGTTTGGAGLNDSCQHYCENLLGCLDEGEHGFTDQDQCVTECELAADAVGTDECDGATIGLNECIAGLECQGVSDWWFGAVSPLPCAAENLGQLVGCDGPEKCAGYCTVGVECLAGESPDFDNFADCLSICVDSYNVLSADCQQPYADLNVCIAGLPGCDDVLSWWNGEGACMAEDEAFLTCGG